MRLIEGADILAARRGEAPFPLLYLDEVDIVETPPAYLQESEREIDDFGSTKAPRGTVVTVRGKPLRPGRALYLTDGKREEAFVPDGSGIVFAKWTLAESTSLRIVARFGDVRIPQSDQLVVTSIPDEPPVVKLEGAPRTVRLVDTPTVKLAYEATDDHGLREIALVLRSGSEVQRRPLARPSTDAKTARGGEELSTREPFFRGSFLPVEVTIEARDNDGVLGGKWGKSAAIVVVPPAVGEPEALRYAALLNVRDALVDATAPRVTREKGEGTPLAKEEVQRQRSADVVIDAVLGGTFGGLGVRGQARTILAGEEKRLDEAVTAFRDKPVAPTYEKLVKTSEDAVLAIDAAVRGQGVRDAGRVAKKLAKVADEIAAEAHAFDKDPDAGSASARLDAAMGVLDAGGKELVTLGDLGFDLGDVVRGGVGRISRPRTANDMVHAEIAARDLADRLKRADASSAWRRKGGRGVGRWRSARKPPIKERRRTLNPTKPKAKGRELDQLIQEHAGEIGKLKRGDEERDERRRERNAPKRLAKEQAQRLRDAVKDLPSDGQQGTPSGKSSEGRKHAEAAAGALEQGQLDEAMQRGDEALKALREGSGMAKDSPFSDDQDVGEDATRAGNQIEQSLDAIHDALEKMKKNAARSREATIPTRLAKTKAGWASGRAISSQRRRERKRGHAR